MCCCCCGCWNNILLSQLMSSLTLCKHKLIRDLFNAVLFTPNSCSPISNSHRTRDICASIKCYKRNYAFDAFQLFISMLIYRIIIHDSYFPMYDNVMFSFIAVFGNIYKKCSKSMTMNILFGFQWLRYCSADALDSEEYQLGYSCIYFYIISLKLLQLHSCTVAQLHSHARSMHW